MACTVCELAEFAGAGHLDGPHEIRAVAPLGAGLVDPAGPAERIGQRPALLDRHRAGLLAVDVLARAGRLDGQRRVPEFRRGDDDGVDVRAGQHFLVVGVHHAVAVLVALIDQLLDELPALFLQVADGDEPGVLVAQHGIHGGHSAAADPDAGDRDLVAGRHRPGALAQHGTGHNQGRRATAPAVFMKSRRVTSPFRLFMIPLDRLSGTLMLHAGMPA